MTNDVTGWTSAFTSAFKFGPAYPQSKIPLIEQTILNIYQTDIGKMIINQLFSLNAANSSTVVTFAASANGDPRTDPTTRMITVGPNTSTGFVNGQGNFVKDDFARLLFHELVHAILQTTDGIYGGNNFPNFAALTSQNSASELLGDTVPYENEFAQEYYSGSDPNSTPRTAYLDGVESQNASFFQNGGQSWTNGNSVDVVILDQTPSSSGAGGGNTIDLKSFGSRTALVVAQAPNDTIFASNGGDYIWVTSGNNKVFGGTGNDVIHAGTGQDTIYGSGGSDTVYGGGDTTVDYSQSQDGVSNITVQNLPNSSSGQGGNGPQSTGARRSPSRAATPTRSSMSRRSSLRHSRAARWR